MSTAAVTPLPMVAQLLQSLEHEHRTTMQVLRALPGDRLDFKPHDRSRSARDLAWHIAYAPYGLARVIAAANFQEYGKEPVPATLDEILAGCESYHQKTREVLSRLTQEQLAASIPLPNGARVPCAGFLWSGVLFHVIHHRGQLSVYVRLMGGKVPSIYGPSADDNPFGT